MALVAGALLLVLVMVVVLATGGRGQAIASGVAQVFQTRFASLGFRVGTLHLQGASPSAQDEIIQAAGLRLGAPIIDVDLAAVRGRVEHVAWVSRARVIRLLPDTVVIAVEQRPLMAVWQHGGHMGVVASDGSLVKQVAPEMYNRLPLIVGPGANTAAKTLLPLIEAWPALERQLAAMVRVDDRRWDLRLKDGAVIMLPAGDEEGGLRRLERLDQSSKILQLGLARIDLRDPAMLVVRPRGAPAPLTAPGGTKG